MQLHRHAVSLLILYCRTAILTHVLKNETGDLRRAPRILLPKYFAHESRGGSFPMLCSRFPHVTDHRAKQAPTPSMQLQLGLSVMRALCLHACHRYFSTLSPSVTRVSLVCVLVRRHVKLSCFVAGTLCSSRTHRESRRHSSDVPIPDAEAYKTSAAHSKALSLHTVCSCVRHYLCTKIVVVSARS